MDLKIILGSTLKILNTIGKNNDSTYKSSLQIDELMNIIRYGNSSLPSMEKLMIQNYEYLIDTKNFS